VHDACVDPISMNMILMNLVSGEPDL